MNSPPCRYRHLRRHPQAQRAEHRGQGAVHGRSHGRRDGTRPHPGAPTGGPGRRPRCRPRRRSPGDGDHGRARRDRGQSVTQIARELGVGRSTLYRALEGDNSPAAELVDDIHRP
ncbi:helix-turn-helix domain-containing protein [Nonomuraea sp. NPDC051941]|uniref:helix-turn-helix domain-containing protein n=1 Tax=Nonomuraea sp. NPDC051941 TaxID=3364373 RepID=UPI0037CA2F5D